MNENFKNKEIIFCDLDGTLIDTISGETFPKGIWDMKLRFAEVECVKMWAYIDDLLPKSAWVL